MRNNDPWFADGVRVLDQNRLNVTAAEIVKRVDELEAQKAELHEALMEIVKVSASPISVSDSLAWVKKVAREAL